MGVRPWQGLECGSGAWQFTTVEDRAMLPGAREHQVLDCEMCHYLKIEETGSSVNRQVLLKAKMTFWEAENIQSLFMIK